MLEQILPIVLTAAPILIAIVVIVLLLVSMIKVARGNEVLVVTGVGATKKVSKKVKVRRGNEEVEEDQTLYEPKIVVAGAAVVIPFLQHAQRFDICVKKASKDNDTMKTKTGVEIVIDWSISYAPNAESIETLQPCIRQFLDKESEETEDIVMSSVAGGMRAVISTMTPQQVMVGKETLDEAVQTNIATQMAELGYKVQIYIQEVRDAKDSTYYYDLAAADREQTRRNAATITAEADQAIREKQAETGRIAKQAELTADVAIAEAERNASIKKANFKAETDKADADAAIAGEMQTTERQRELTEKQGAVEVMKQQQADLAAKAEQTVLLTQAETAKRQSIINEEAEAAKMEIQAKATATVAETAAAGQAKALKAEAEGKANAAKLEASGEAEADRLRAEGRANAVKLEAAAEAERISATGAAEATAIEARGRAEAAAIEARGIAEAEAALKLSEAQAANDRVNFEIQKLEIQRDTTVQVATSVAQVMAKIGENATFYDFGGSSLAGDGSDLLTRILSNIPQVFAKANLANQALNGQELPGTIHDLASAVLGPLGGAIHGNAATPEGDEPGASGVVDGSDAPTVPDKPGTPAEEAADKPNKTGKTGKSGKSSKDAGDTPKA